MQEEDRLTEHAENARVGQKLARLYERYGMEQTFGYLLSSRADAHVDHIQCAPCFWIK